jgi:hypothetical protein
LPLLKSHPTPHMKGNKTETREPSKEWHHQNIFIPKDFVGTESIRKLS